MGPTARLLRSSRPLAVKGHVQRVRGVVHHPEQVVLVEGLLEDRGVQDRELAVQGWRDVFWRRREQDVAMPHQGLPAGCDGREEAAFERVVRSGIAEEDDDLARAGAQMV